jgi:hypothetical protein
MANQPNPQQNKQPKATQAQAQRESNTGSTSPADPQQVERRINEQQDENPAAGEDGDDELQDGEDDDAETEAGTEPSAQGNSAARPKRNTYSQERRHG